MADILIRNLSDAAVEEIDRRAGEVGLSRNEYLRRRFEVDIVSKGPEITIDDLKRASYATRDLLDPEVMEGAWR